MFKEDAVMQVLSRKSGEQFLIGDDITVTIIRIGPNVVRVGIEAPRGVRIVREELLVADVTETRQVGDDASETAET